MNLDNVIFIDALPKLDLHGYDRETARVAINDFIRDQQKQKKTILVIVHGIGSGIIYKCTQETLKQNHQVLEYKTYYFNRGCTLLKIK